MNKHEWDELKDQIAIALVDAGLGNRDWPVDHLAEAARDAALPQGEHGICVAENCRNPATTDIGFPVCVWHSELTDVGAAWDTARVDAEEAWDVAIGNGWIQRVEAVIRDRIADEFRVLADGQDRSPMARMTFLDAARIAQGDHSAT